MHILEGENRTKKIHANITDWSYSYCTAEARIGCSSCPPSTGSLCSDTNSTSHSTLLVEHVDLALAKGEENLDG